MGKFRIEPQSYRKIYTRQKAWDLSNVPMIPASTLCSKQVQSVQVTQEQSSLENLLVEYILQVFKFLNFSDQPDSIFDQIFFFFSNYVSVQILEIKMYEEQLRD